MAMGFQRPRFDELDPTYGDPGAETAAEDTAAPAQPSERPLTLEGTSAVASMQPDTLVEAPSHARPGRGRSSFAQELAAASGLRGTFQQAGTRGALAFRGPGFFKDRFTNPAATAATSIGAGTPLAQRIGGERDDEAQRAFRMARLGAKVR